MYHYYGGRGIGYDQRWDNFLAFYVDMGECLPGLTLERKDNDLGYYKENCCWDTRRVQAINRRMRNTNTSGYRGVCETHKSSGRWFATLCNNGISYRLSNCDTKHEAADNYNFLAVIFHGEHAHFNTNIPPFTPSREHPLLQFIKKYPGVIPIKRLPQMVADLQSLGAA
jgi:hypothetical protein